MFLVFRVVRICIVDGLSMTDEVELHCFFLEETSEFFKNSEV